MKSHSWNFCHLQPHCLPPAPSGRWLRDGSVLPCSRVARVEAKGRQEQRRWDNRAGLFPPVARCAAPPASASRIWRGQTLPLAEGFVPPRCRALCFRGSAPAAAESWLCLPATSMLQRQPGSAWGRAAPERERVVWCGPIPGTGISPKPPASGWRRGAHAAWLGSLVLSTIPPLPHHARQRCVIILQVCTPLFPLPGSLGHSLGIPQQLQTLLGSREILSAVHLFLPCKGQVRLGLALQCVPRIFFHRCLSFHRNNQC